MKSYKKNTKVIIEYIKDQLGEKVKETEVDVKKYASFSSCK